MAHWPEYFKLAESPSGKVMGYSKFMFSRIVCIFLYIFFSMQPQHSVNVMLRFAHNGIPSIISLLFFFYHFIYLVMGKAEGAHANEQWHGHVTCLSVAPEFRRLGMAAKLMKGLEEISEK